MSQTNNWICCKCGGSNQRPGRTDCADCHRERAKARYYENLEQSRSQARLYQQSNRVESAERSRKWRENNREQFLNNQKDWHKEHPDYRKEYMLRDGNLQRKRLYDRERYRKSRRGCDTQTREYTLLLLNDPCSYCGRESSAIDHIIPISEGGPNDWDNMTVACTSCNSSKGAKTLLHFLSSKAP